MCHPEPFAYGRPSDGTQSDCTVILKEPLGIVILSPHFLLSQESSGGEGSVPLKKRFFTYGSEMTGGKGFRRLPEQSEGMTNHTVTKSLPHDIMRKNLCPRIDEMITVDFRIYNMEKFKGSMLIRKEMTKMNGKAYGLTN